MEKYHQLYSTRSEIKAIDPSIIESVKKMLEKPYKTRFVIKVGEHLRSVSTVDILCFYSQDKTTHICTSDNRLLIIDYSLDHIMELIDPEQFFMINRKAIVNRDAITDIVAWSKTRLKLSLKVDLDEPPVVSREKVNPFKEWLDR